MSLSWLKRFKFDPGLLVAVLIATLAAWPLLTRASLPTFTEAEMHVYRTWQIMEAWKAGVWYLRWAPDFFYGFGYPLFNYYAPLTYYLGAAYGFLSGQALDLPLQAAPAAGVKFVLVAAVYLGAAGMYLFVRDRWGGVAGVISAAAFAFAPYVVYIDPLARGDAPETFAIALAPPMLWAFSRLRRTASPGDAVLAAVSLAALLASHNFMGVIFFGLLVAWLAWDLAFGPMFLQAWVLDENHTGAARRRAVVAMLIWAIALGLGLAACVWLPALLERNAVQYHAAVAARPDFHDYFVRVEELFAPTQWFDLGATAMRFNYSLGVPQALLAGLGLLSVFSLRTRRLSVLFFGFATLGFIYLVLPSSERVWEAVPALALLQFPTVFMGPAAVTLAVLAGAAVSWAEPLRLPGRGVGFAVVAVAFCLGGALPLLYPPTWSDFGPVTTQRYFALELSGRALGTTPDNDFLPAQVAAIPSPVQSLLDSYVSGRVDKINRAAIPAGSGVTVVEHGPQLDRFRVTGNTRFVLRPYTFDFPGWAAYVDGQRTAIEPSQPEGWITLWVPEGTHDVLLRFEDTRPRIAGWILTGVALSGMLALAVWRLRLSLIRPQSERLPWRQSLALGAVLIVGLSLRYVADGQDWWRLQSTGHDVRVAQYKLFQPLEGNVALLGFDLPDTAARAGDRVPVTVYWQAQAPVAQDLHVFVHFIGPDGQLWGQSDKVHPADFPTRLWPLDRYVRDEHVAQLRPDAPPGPYTVVAGLWDNATQQRLHRLDARNHPTPGDGVVLTTAFTVR